MPEERYTDDQWEVLGAILELLPRAAAQLKLVFAERGETDFTEIAQGAVRALGTPDNPTDLLLALDTRIKHILVDEFQDTSYSQYELLEKLTSGWERDDGRTPLRRRRPDAVHLQIPRGEGRALPPGLGARPRHASSSSA